MNGCVIVDNDVAHHVRIGAQGGQGITVFDYRDIHRGLVYSKGPCKAAVLAYGGQLTEELFGDADTRSWLRLLDAAGKAVQEPFEAVHDLTENLRASGRCRSNDAHIIALAMVSGARILCTRDSKSGLMDDFRNVGLLDPVGRIYKSRAHNPLVQQKCRG